MVKYTYVEQTKGDGMGTHGIIKFTEEGLRKAESYIEELRAKRKEILDAGLDTVEDTTLPETEDILSDVLFIGISWDDPDGPCYYNCWGVTDNYSSDLPVCLYYGEDFVPADKDAEKVISIVLENGINLPVEAAYMKEHGRCRNPALLGFSDRQIAAAMELY